MFYLAKQCKLVLESKDIQFFLIFIPPNTVYHIAHFFKKTDVRPTKLNEK
jgi:hypothetical protein